MHSHTIDWSRLLLDRLDDELAVAKARGLLIDPALIGSAHVFFGVEFLIHAADIDRAGVAFYLSQLAETVEDRDWRLPLLVSLGNAGT